MLGDQHRAGSVAQALKFDFEAMCHIRGKWIGAIFQDPLTSLKPLHTVSRQLTQTILAHLPVSAKEARERAISLLNDTGIPGAQARIDHDPHQFSGVCANGW